MILSYLRTIVLYLVLMRVFDKRMRAKLDKAFPPVDSPAAETTEEPPAASPDNDAADAPPAAAPDNAMEIPPLAADSESPDGFDLYRLYPAQEDPPAAPEEEETPCVPCEAAAEDDGL